MTKLNWPGIEKGDTVMIHSSLSRTCKENNVTPVEVLESFIDLVGPEGTLIFPVFNFSTFNKGLPFDYHKTPSEMGILSEMARTWPGAVRSGHPISGWVGIGEGAERMCGNLANSFAYTIDSPLVAAYNVNAKIAVLDLNAQAALTMYHFVEQTLGGVDWRYSKQFEGEYIDKDGNKENRSFELYVKHGWGETDADPMDEVLWALGLYEGDRPFIDSGLRIIRAQALCYALTLVMQHGKNGGEGLIWRKVQEIH